MRRTCARVASAALLGVLLLAAGASAQESVRVGVYKDGRYTVERVPMETYVARVLAGEAARESPPAALEALAIVIRTYATTNLGRHTAAGFDLCDQTHCQVMRTATAATTRAAVATAGQRLYYQGTPATVYYSASCGGHTQRPSGVWPGAADPPYLPVQDDDACEGTPAWSSTVAVADLQRSLRSAGFAGTLRGLHIDGRDASGRVLALSLTGMTPNRISGQDVRMAVARTLGPLVLQSAAFEVAREGAAYRFSGHGFGHGVGLCVIGSVKRATRGESAAAMLAVYFPGTTIGTSGGTTIGPVPAPRVRPVPPPTIGPTPPATIGPTTGALPAPSPSTAGSRAAAVAVELPEGDEGERRVIEALVARERATMDAALGLTAPMDASAADRVAPLSVIIHGVVASFEAATRVPWFTLGAARDGVIHLPPLSVVRTRGGLERALRRQLVHLRVDSVLAARPAWVREGAAAWFAVPESPIPARPGACPSAAELTAPTSPGAFADATARARACFARALTRAGGRWQSVR